LLGNQEFRVYIRGVLSKSDFLSIKNWSDDDKPREKLIEKGKQSLSNSELLAILLSTGTKEKSALDLAKELLDLANNDLNQLAKLNIKELCTVNGIGPAKAITVIAAIELAGRREMNSIQEKKFIKSSKDAYVLVKNHLMDLNHEEFWIVLLKRNNEIINKHRISEGGMSSTTVDPKKIFKLAIQHGASSMIIFHNHPSGNLQPSESDLKLTKQLNEAGKVMEISVLDHIIVAQNSFYSFADNSMM